MLNRAGATCTDTIHRIRLRAGVDGNWLAAASINSLTLAFAEIRGRSYGGGVLELEPTEAESLPFPTSEGQHLNVNELNSLHREKGLECTLSEVDKVVLVSMGLSTNEIAMLREIWRKLYQRRLSRKQRSQSVSSTNQ